MARPFCTRKKIPEFILSFFLFYFLAQQMNELSGERHNVIDVRKENETKYKFDVHVDAVLFT